MFDFLTITPSDLPNDEERQRMARKQTKIYQPYHLNQVYPHLTSAGIPTIDATIIELSPEELRAFYAWNEHSINSDAESMKESRNTPELLALSDKIAHALTLYPSGSFTRLGSRSPKHGWNQQHDDNGIQRPCYNVDDVFRAYECSERILTDLMDSAPIDAPMALILRPYQHQRTETNEFRAFVQGGNIAGMCPMFPDAWNNNNDIIPHLRQRVEETIAALPLMDYTIDLMINDASTLCVLEINPPTNLGADPIVFRERPFDGAFHATYD